MKWHLCLRLLVLPFAFAAASIHAEEVEFPDEELAKESVLPKFENPKDVLRRHVVNTGRFEFGAGGGLEIDEPFYNDLVFNLHGGYHFTDLHGVNVQALIWSPGLSNYGNKLKGDTNLGNFDASKAPHPVWGVIGNYEFTAYYGKVSLTKHMVMNLNLFAYAGPVYINMKGYNSFGGNIGLGQNFFITPRMSIRFDLRMLIFPGPNAAQADLRSTAATPSSYSTRLFFNNQMGLSLVFLL